MATFFDTEINFESQYPNMGLIALSGAEAFAKKVDDYLVNWYNEAAKKQGKPFHKDTFLVKCVCPRFTSGDGKALIKDSVRGMDVYIVCDVGNYSITYNMFGQQVPMSPDDIYADLKRVICAMGGKAARISVIMPILYGGRQHRRTARESLDCAMMLREMEDLGVREIITFDAHDPRVQNAAPLMGFDNFMPHYQVLKALLRNFPGLRLDKNHFMCVSPDEGAMFRNIYYASILGVDLGMFYKRRDYSIVVNGRNPIVAHEYIGSAVMGMDVFIADDIIATGESLISLAQHLKQAGANRIFLCATFALFTEGIDKFRKAHEEGLFDAVISTNLTYAKPEVLAEPWFIQADMSKFAAYIVSACNQDSSVSSLLDPHDKIAELIERYNANGLSLK
ncbi:MAG: ribose-phosphate pyrophosphokinase [Clostridia bacterium]|nr:ribose-phosphate pyrophosphokinase [Clostridia bacterium]